MPRSITGTPLRRRTSRIAALLAAPAAAICLLSGCSAGQVDQTSTMVAAVPGVQINSKPNGQAALRDVRIVYNSPEGYPVDGTAPLSVYIANNNPGKPLVLRGVTATAKDGGAIGTVVLTGGRPEVGAQPSPTPSAASTSHAASAAPSASASGRASAAPSGGASGSANPSASETQSASENESAKPSPSASAAGLTIPANGYAKLDPHSGAYLAITGLAQPLAPGSVVRVTFDFEGESPLQIEVPFSVPLSPAPRITTSVNEHEESGAHGE
ncbi:hypothetical protein ACNTMW_16635 [Planosporangium sp. 12N6]|uniref:hypothetical protein n=1 Tax=Planosporangium spinosum TaxID=3402278 RepID=UPI003CED2EB6